MFWCKLKESVYKFALDSFKNAIGIAKDQYPKIKSSAEKTEEKIKKEGLPVLSKTSENVSKFVFDKYSEAMELSKKTEKERKAAKMRAIRNTIIGTTLGFTAGAATGYVLVKKSQIKQSDYVFSDEEELKEIQQNAASQQNPVAKTNPAINQNPIAQQNPAPQQNTAQNINPRQIAAAQNKKQQEQFQQQTQFNA